MSMASVPVAIARVAWSEGGQEDFCGGISFSGDEATLVARCEGLERLHVIAPRANESLIHGSYAELSDDAVDPASLFFRVSWSRTRPATSRVRSKHSDVLDVGLSAAPGQKSSSACSGYLVQHTPAARRA